MNNSKSHHGKYGFVNFSKSYAILVIWLFPFLDGLTLMVEVITVKFEKSCQHLSPDPNPK
jgi:hypothetical protein